MICWLSGDLTKPENGKRPLANHPPCYYQMQSYAADRHCLPPKQPPGTGNSSRLGKPQKIAHKIKIRSEPRRGAEVCRLATDREFVGRTVWNELRCTAPPFARSAKRRPKSFLASNCWRHWPRRAAVPRSSVGAARSGVFSSCARRRALHGAGRWFCL